VCTVLEVILPVIAKKYEFLAPQLTRELGMAKYENVLPAI
jgi:hypothetical protein